MNQFTWANLHKYQPDVYQILSNSFAQKRVSHAYIFEGPIGTKRLEAAFLFAKTLLCQNKTNHMPCEHCHHCQRVNHLTHPNLFFVQPEGEKIKKKQIKELLDEFAKSSLEEGPRIYIIDQAERFNQESGNTLLKTMEEPGSNIYAIMVTDSINAILNTIVSRAFVIHFKPIDKRIILDELTQAAVSPKYSSMITEYTNNVEDAKSIATSAEKTAIIDLVCELYQAVLEPNQSMVLLFKSNRDALFQKSENLDFFVSTMTYYLKDILNHKLRHLNQIVLKTEMEVIEKLSQMSSQVFLDDALDKILGLKTKLKYNINSSLAFDKMLAYLERGFHYGVPSRSDSV